MIKLKKEVIITGCGIALKKKIGQSIERDKIEKLYELKNPSFENEIKELSDNVPEGIFQVSSRIIKYA